MNSKEFLVEYMVGTNSLPIKERVFGQQSIVAQKIIRDKYHGQKVVFRSCIELK